MVSILRALLLSASKSKRLQDIATNWPLAREMSHRFVAGETLDDAVAVVRALNRKGITVSLDHLGESVETIGAAKSAAGACLAILDAIDRHKLEATLSLKLTQLGLDIDEKECERMVVRIAGRAASYGTRICIDMEGSDYTQRTIDFYLRLARSHKNIGIVIQSYLYRSEKDVRELIKSGADLRLCKGAYKEPADIAFPEKKRVDENYTRLLDILFSDEARSHKAYPCVATHDKRLIDYTKKLVKERGVSPKDFEFQMLHGIRTDLQRLLVREGYRMRVYVPYGTEWYPYFVRRLAERPANLWFFAKNLVRK